MGLSLIAEEWLLSLQQRDGTANKLATDLLRAQILTARRTGHVLVYGTEYIRRRIVHSARYGQLPDLVMPCSVCGTQAKLSEWVRASHYDDGARAAAIALLAERNKPWRIAFLRPCPGPEIAADLAASTHLPAER